MFLDFSLWLISLRKIRLFAFLFFYPHTIGAGSSEKQKGVTIFNKLVLDLSLFIYTLLIDLVSLC